MTALDMIEFSERLIAFDAIMKGKLKKETEDAKLALGNFKLGKDLCIVRNQLEDQKKAFEIYKQKSEKTLADYKDKLAQQEQELQVREESLKDGIYALNQDRQAVQAQITKLSRDRVDLELLVTYTQAGAIARTKELELFQQKLTEKQHELNEREAALQHKLDVMKSL